MDKLKESNKKNQKLFFQSSKLWIYFLLLDLKLIFLVNSKLE